MQNKKSDYGTFGNLSKQYDEARQGFPQKIIDYFWSLIRGDNSTILDVGCGTGISTRQLMKDGARVLGSDNDPEMVKQAQAKQNGINYVVAPADKIPFEGGQFDAVTAFSAFHWFCDKESVNEIRRVLKNGGVFFVVNKNDVGDFKKEYKELLGKFIEGELPDAKKKYDPKTILKENGLKDIQEKHVPASEFFTLPQAIAYLQSVSLWNLVPESKKAEALRAMEDYCKDKLVDDHIERKFEVVAVVGMK